MLQRHAEQNGKLRFDFIRYKGISVYPDYRNAFIDDKELELTKKEFDILHMLIQNHKRVFTYEQIYESVLF